MRIFMWTVSVLLTGMILSLLVASWQTRDVAVSGQMQPANNSDELNMLQQELVSLRQQVAQLQADRASAASPADTSSTDYRDTTALTDPDAAYRSAFAAEQERTATTINALENSMIGEPVDPSWAGYAESEVSHALQDSPDLSATQLTAMNCQSTLCRIDARHHDSAAEMGFLMQLGQLESFRDGQAFSQRMENDDGSIDTVIFVSRTGYTLPEQMAN